MNYLQFQILHGCGYLALLFLSKAEAVTGVSESGMQRLMPALSTA